MIELSVPVEKIPYIRTIEGRKFKNGKWQFPDSALTVLQQYELIDSNIVVSKKEKVQYELSPYLRDYQQKIVNNALNEGCYAIFSETGTGKSPMGLEIATHFDKALILCPLSVIETAWIDDCHRFYPDKIIMNCHGSSKTERLEKLNSKADIYIMNYESFKILKNEIRNVQNVKSAVECFTKSAMQSHMRKSVIIVNVSIKSSGLKL